ncbi:MAG: hypothetical protein HKM28_07065 [Flavobacteriaceae bacterium]|nr:hypothetical protein [Flavobacteriaceae bacterium]
MKKCIAFYLCLTLTTLSLGWSQEKTDSSYTLFIFEGSDWCHNCIRLEKNILSTSNFQEFIQTKKIELELIDFPQRKKLAADIIAYNARIAEQYQFKGVYPTLILVNRKSGQHVEIDYSNDDSTSLIAKLENQKGIWD